jgi:GT2 family glycosyltransferase
MITMQRSWEYSSYALKTFAKNTPFDSSDQFVLIDDGSFGGAPDWVLPNVKVIEGSASRGFAENVNRGLEIAHTRESDLFILHNDVVFPSGWIEPFERGHHGIMVATTNQDVHHHVGGIEWGSVMLLTDYSKRAPLVRELMKMQKTCAETPLARLSVPMVSACISRDVYLKIGEFDCSFGKLGGEAEDYSLRAVESGFEILQHPHSFVVHFAGKSSVWGGEKNLDTKVRVETARTHFNKKWGGPLTKLVFDGNMSVLDSEIAWRELYAQSDFRELIRLMKASMISGLHLNAVSTQ